MSNNTESKYGKILIGMAIGILLTISILFILNKFSYFKQLRNIQYILQQNENFGEPTDLPIYNEDILQEDENYYTWREIISLEDAQKIAIEAVGGGHIIFYEEDIYDLDDNPTYDFKIKNGNKIYEVEVDALTGDIIDFDID